MRHAEPYLYHAIVFKANSPRLMKEFPGLKYLWEPLDMKLTVWFPKSEDNTPFLLLAKDYGLDPW